MENIATRPNDLIPVSDDYLLAEKNDEIDNSVFSFVAKVVNDKNPRVAFDVAAEAYCCDRSQYEALDEKSKKDLYHTTVSHTTETIEEAFKNVVLPKNIKLDISNKIEKPIKEGLLELSERVNGTLSRVEEGEKMMLQILTLFTHFQKLPDDVREQIEDFINEDALSMDAKL